MIEGAAAVLLGLYLLARAWGAKRLRSPRSSGPSAGSFALLLRHFRRGAGGGAIQAAGDACRLPLSGGGLAAQGCVTLSFAFF